MLPFVETLNLAQEPTCGQLDNGMMAVLSEDQKTNDGVLHVGHEKYGVSMRKVKAS